MVVTDRVIVVKEDATQVKPLIYSKQYGEPCVPLTVRIEWFPDGVIKPVMLWTPDGCCLNVKRICDMTPLALLKDRGEGLRYRIITGAPKAAEPQAGGERSDYTDYTDYTDYSRRETYLYLADNWFCGRNIVDTRYGHGHKEFVRVMLDVFSDAEYELICFWVKDSRYIVEKTIAVEPRGSYRAGGMGIWHKVGARLVNADDDEDPDPARSVRRQAALFFEINKWFVATADGP